MSLREDTRLVPMGLTFRHAADGRKALEAARSESPVLAIVDLVMPRMDGFALCRALRAESEPRLREVPLLVISGVYRDRKVIEQLLDEVRGRFLAKPFSGTDLAAAVMGMI